MEQRFTFDTVAALYDAVRPSYPEKLFDDATAHLGPGERILEVGSGTGKATASFAARNFPILALEPGGRMIAAAEKSLANFGNIKFVETTFESWPPASRRFGLVAAAQSWHWVDRNVGFAKAAQVLRPHGVLAVFGNVPVGIPEPLRGEFLRIYASHIPLFSNVVPEASYLPSGPFASMYDASGYFTSVIHKAYPWRWAHTAQSYPNFLRSRSDHQMMGKTMLETILSEIADAITTHGGSFEIDYEAHLYMAMRK
jgi:ubiquinone/menaquinone biosynthesis C-methylase UbiE